MAAATLAVLSYLNEIVIDLWMMYRALWDGRHDGVGVQGAQRPVDWRIQVAFGCLQSYITQYIMLKFYYDIHLIVQSITNPTFASEVP